MEKIVELFQKYTDHKFQNIEDHISEIKRDIKELNTFKTEIMLSSKYIAKSVSLAIGAVCGFVSLIVTIVVAFYK